MADNLTTQTATPATVPDSTVIGTDEVGVNGGTTSHVQFVKVVDGRANGTDGLPGDTQGAWVVPRRDLQRISVQSAGLTTTATAYSIGDQVGTQFTFANAARASGGTGTIVGAMVIDANDVIGPMDLAIFQASVTLASDNAAFSISDSDALNLVGWIQMVGAVDIGGNRVCQAHSIAIGYACSGSTSLFGALMTRAAIAGTPFAAVTNLQVILNVERN